MLVDRGGQLVADRQRQPAARRLRTSPPSSSCSRNGHSSASSRPLRSSTGNSTKRVAPRASASRICWRHARSPRGRSAVPSTVPARTVKGSSFSARASAASAAPSSADKLAPRCISTAPNATLMRGPNAGSAACKRLRQRLRGFGGDVGHRQRDREVRSVEPPDDAAFAVRRIRTQHLRDRLQSAVGRFVAEALVEAGQVAHAQQHQPAFGRTVLANDHAGQLGKELAPVGDAGERIVVRLYAQRLDLRGLRVEQRLHALHHRVHRFGDALQLGHARLEHANEAAFDQRVGLRHGGFERAPDAAHREGRRPARRRCRPARAAPPSAT